MKYRTRGVCASEIEFEIDNGTIKSVHFTGGCPGNAEAISKLVEGMTITEISKKLRGIVCRNRTSCADQLAIALEQLAKDTTTQSTGDAESTK